LKLQRKPLKGAGDKQLFKRPNKVVLLLFQPKLRLAKNPVTSRSFRIKKRLPFPATAIKRQREEGFSQGRQFKEKLVTNCPREMSTMMEKLEVIT